VLAAGSAAATTEVRDVDGGPLGVLATGPTAATTEVGDVDGGPLEVLAASPTAATTEGGDVDDGPSGGCWRQVRQRPPLELGTSMATPLRPWRYEVSFTKKMLVVK
jgi:hypothetical protein